jgi:hypothetical protein
MKTRVNRWRRQTPESDGWWKFDEDGTGLQDILVSGGCVASDDEWEQSVGRPPTDCENYWEGSDLEEMTLGPLTTGKWLYMGFVPDRLQFITE